MNKFPQYLSDPPQILWFQPDDMMIFILGVTLALLFGGWFYLLAIILPVSYMRIKKGSARGFLKHTLYYLGFVEIKGYPSSFSEEFTE